MSKNMVKYDRNSNQCTIYGGLQKIKLDTNMIGFLLDKMEVHDE